MSRNWDDSLNRMNSGNSNFCLRRPPNAFGQFLRLQTQNVPGSPSRRMKDIGEMWRQSPESVRQQCLEMAKREMQIYQ